MDLTLLLIIGGALAIILLIVGLVISIRGQKSEVDERLGRYAGTEKPKPSEEEKKAQSQLLTEWLNRSVAKSTFGERIAKDLARADMKFKPGEYIALMVIASVVMAALLWFVGGKSILTGVLGLAIGPFLPRFYVKSQQSKRLVKFNDQLPDMLNLMVNGLRAGYSVMQAMEAVSKELPPPICDEFRRVVQEMSLGVSTEKTLDNLLRRIPSDDLDLCVTAMNVQREVGGNLAEILDTISFTIRERVRIKGEIRVLTSQQSFSGLVLSLMPVAVVGILFLINREYMMEFVKSENNTPIPCGYIALGCSLLLILTGYFTMKKLGKIDV
jgi:tight adherence protein B